MLIFRGEEDRKSVQETQKILGERIGLKTHLNFETTGSNLYHIVSIESKNSIYQDIFSESRCNFEKFPKGLLLWINKKQQITRMAIPFDELNEVKLIRGEEKTSKKWNILNLGLWIFRIPYQKLKFLPYWFMVYKYKDPAHLILNTKDFVLTLKTHGFNYKSEAKFFKSVLKNN